MCTVPPYLRFRWKLACVLHSGCQFWDIDKAIGRKRVSKNIAVVEGHDDMSDFEIGAP